MAKNKKGTVKDGIPGQKANPVILLFLLLSGSCGLVYEILWMKMLTLVIGNTVFSITTVLTAFMGGLALGSFLAGRFIDKIKNPFGEVRSEYNPCGICALSVLYGEIFRYRIYEIVYLVSF